MTKIHDRIIVINIRKLIEKELEYYKYDVPPESDDVHKGIERAEIAISRAFRKFEEMTR